MPQLTLSTDISAIQSYNACIALRDSYQKQAKEERKFASEGDIFNTTLFTFGSGAIGSIVPFGFLEVAVKSQIYDSKTIIEFGSSALNYSIGIGATITTIGTLVLFWQLSQKSSHHAHARNFEQKAREAELRAAEIPYWKDYGMISGFFARMFSTGNPVKEPSNRWFEISAR